MPDAPAPAPAAPPGPPPVLTTAELIQEVAKEAAAAPPAPDGAAPPGDAPADGKPPEAKPDDVALVHLAREQRRIDGQKRQLAERERALTGAAEDGQHWRATKALAAGKDRLQAARALFGSDLTELYWELNEDVLKNSAPPSQDEVIDRRVEAKLEARRKAEDDAREAAATKTRGEEQQAREAKATQVQQGLEVVVNGLNATLQKEPGRYPALMAAVTAYGKRGKEAVSRGDIESFVKDYVATKSLFPSDEDILGHFDAELRATFDEIRPAGEQTAPGRTVTSSWRADSPVKPDREKSLAEITLEAKREAGILR